ncbi:M23 family metallopeptidase [Candidatus Saccharibacteria bacterium]|jgi:hypothetical protein|nr:M23 family metallopeptidase [Candidatus Saccharibacteria bacterium]
MAVKLDERTAARNPGDDHAERLFSNSQNLNDAENNPGGIDMSAFEDSYKNKTADPSQENANIQKAKAGESSSFSSPATPHVSTNSKAKKPSNNSGTRPNLSSQMLGQALNFAKKSGPLFPIIIIFIVSILFLLAIFTPGLAIVQLSESFKMDLDDTLSNLELRTNHIFRAKMKNKVLTRGCMGGALRCKFKSFSATQMDKLKTAGFSFEPDNPKKTKLGRFKPKAFNFVDSKGNTHRITPKNFQRMYSSNPEFRAHINEAYNPKWKGLRDSIAKKAFGRFHIDFRSRFSGKVNQMKSALRNFVQKGGSGDVNMNKNRISENRTGDPDGSAADAENKAKTKLSEQRSGRFGAKKMLKMGMTGANIIVGFQQMVCALLKTTEMVSMSSKLLQYSQLMRYAFLFLSSSDQIKSGAMSHEIMEFVGSLLTHSDMRLNTISEDGMNTSSGSLLDAFGSNEEVSLSVLPTSNPDYGKNALDSAGAKTSMYGKPTQGVGIDPFHLSTRESQYIVGGGMGFFIDNIISKVRQYSLGGLSRDTCDFYDNFVVQGGSFLLSLAAIAGTAGGAAVAAGVKAAAQTIAVQFVMRWLNGKISDILSGENVNDETKGIDAGNAWFSGAGAIFANSASSRGIGPASTEGEIRNMQALRVASLETDAKVERFLARDTPFDIFNKYSFLGSIVWRTFPATLSTGSKLKSATLAPFHILSSVGKTFSPIVGAATTTPIDRFKQCQDPAFTGGGVIVSEDDQNVEVDKTGINLNYSDIMCNIRFSNRPTDLNADPERVADWMVDAAQADAESGEPITSRETMKSLHENRVPKSEISTADTAETPEMNTIEPGIQVYPTVPPAGTGSSPSSYSRPIDMPVAEVLRPDDETLAFLGIPTNTPSEKIADYNPGSSTVSLAQASANNINANDKRYLPPPISTFDWTSDDNYDPERDVRTYAHWYRYCRYGPEEARTVPFGMLDTDDEDSVFDKITAGALKDKYVNDSRECLRSNDCKAGADPNGADWSQDPNDWRGEESMRKRCRPAQYDIYSIFHMDKLTEDSLDEEDDDPESDGKSTGDHGWPVVGDGQIVTTCYQMRWGAPHAAIDIAAAGDLEIVASDGGEVTEVAHNDSGFTGFGETVVVKHGDGYYSRYSHMKAGSIAVKVGDKVDKGTKIGIMGSTGFSTGVHLDYGISKEPQPYNTNSENPLKFFDIPSDVTNQAGCSKDDTI